MRVVTAPITAERDRIKGSRFVADLAPAVTEDQALAVVASVRQRHPDASHHCWAFRLAGGRARSDDDGEPGGTAGPPILRHLDGAELADVVCVVTRWFGGTKLGTGGLVRAYGDAAAAAIEDATIAVGPVLARYRVVHPFDLTGPIAAVLAAHDVTTVTADYGMEVELTVTVPVAVAEAFTTALADATSGQVTAVPA